MLAAAQHWSVSYNKKEVIRSVSGGDAPLQVEVKRLKRDDYFRLVLAADSGCPVMQRYVLQTARGDSLREFRFRGVKEETGVVIKAMDILRWRRQITGKTILWYIPEVGEPVRVAELVILAIED